MTTLRNGCVVDYIQLAPFKKQKKSYRISLKCHPLFALIILHLSSRTPSLFLIRPFVTRIFSLVFSSFLSNFPGFSAVWEIIADQYF